VTRKSITIHYRRLEDVTNAFRGVSLEQAIRRAMVEAIDGTRLADQWKLRTWSLPPNGEDTIFTNIYQDDGDAFFGDLTQYTRGFMQTLFSQMGDAPMIPVEQQPPPAGKEYVHSMMYWLAIGNHMLLAQSRSLTAKHLEEYLSWLLRERTATIDSGHVMLQAKFATEEAGGDLDDISKIVIGGTAAPASTPEAQAEAVARDVPVYREIGERRPWSDRAWDVVRAVMNNEADVEQLRNSIPEDADLQVSVHLGYRTHRRRMDRAPMQLALRNLPEGEIVAEGRHGRLTGKDLRLSYTARIEELGSLLDPNDVLRAMREAYAYFVENGRITP